MSSADLKAMIDNYIKTYIQAAKDTAKESEKLDQEELAEVAEGAKELMKLIKLLEKRANPQAYTHLAPVFGYKGESGIRQWMLKFPERKLKVLMSPDSPGKGAIKDLYDNMFDVISNQLSQYYNIKRFMIEDNLRAITRFPQNKDLGELFSGYKGRSREEIISQLQGALATTAKMAQDAQDLSKLYADLTWDEIHEVYKDMDGRVLDMRDRVSDDPNIKTIDDLSDESYDFQEAIDVIKGKNALSGVVGHVLRYMVNKPVIDKIFTVGYKKWLDKITEMLKDENLFEGDGDQAKKIKRLVEYFTGAKNLPVFNDVDNAKVNSKSALEFLRIGIGAEKFMELYDRAWTLLDDIFAKELAEGGSFEKYAKVFEKMDIDSDMKEYIDFRKAYQKAEDNDDIAKPQFVQKKIQKAGKKILDFEQKYIDPALDDYEELLEIEADLSDIRAELEKQRTEQTLKEMFLLNGFIELLL
jgi:hypothetical protein